MQIIVADSFLKRGIGLLLHKKFDGGMLFYKTTQIHTFFMRFAIDVVFCDKDSRILKIYHDLKPFRMTKIHWQSFFVVEFAAGFAKKNNLKEGDIFKI